MSLPIHRGETTVFIALTVHNIPNPSCKTLFKQRLMMMMIMMMIMIIMMVMMIIMRMIITLIIMMIMVMIIMRMMMIMMMIMRLFSFSSTTKVPAHKKYKTLTKEKPPTTFTLPQKFKHLLEIFRCVDSVIFLLNRRSEVCTFDRLKKSVQSMLGKYVQLLCCIRMIRRPSYLAQSAPFPVHRKSWKTKRADICACYFPYRIL